MTVLQMREPQNSTSVDRKAIAVAQQQRRHDGGLQQQEQLSHVHSGRECITRSRTHRSRSREESEEETLSSHVASRGNTQRKGREGRPPKYSDRSPSRANNSSSAEQSSSGHHSRQLYKNSSSNSYAAPTSSRSYGNSCSDYHGGSTYHRNSSASSSFDVAKGNSGRVDVSQHHSRGEQGNISSSSSSSSSSSNTIYQSTNEEYRSNTKRRRNNYQSRCHSRRRSDSGERTKSRSSERVQTHSREGGGMMRLLQTAACAAAVAERDAAALREKTLHAAAAAQRREEAAARARRNSPPGRAMIKEEAASGDSLVRDPAEGEHQHIRTADCDAKGTYNWSGVNNRGKYGEETTKKQLADALGVRQHLHQHSSAVASASNDSHTQQGSSYVKRLKKEEDTATAAASAAAERVLLRSSNSNATTGSYKTPQSTQRERTRWRYTWGEGNSSSSSGRPTAEFQRGDRRFNHHEESERDTPGKPPLEPNFEVSGLLQEDAPQENMRAGVQLKHSAPPDAAMPSKRWRLYMFKRGKDIAAEDVAAQEPVKTLHLHRRSSFLFGKDSRVADVLLLHPTISKQHAVLQFRSKLGDVHPYIIDLESTNGTFLNGKKIETGRYYQLFEQDTLRFGKSTRDFVLLHTDSVNVDLSYGAFLESRDPVAL